MEYVTAFVVGGLICVIGQLLMDLTTLTPAHVMSILVVAGAVLDGFGLYEPLIDFAGAGATVPITSFGNASFTGRWRRPNGMGSSGSSPGFLK